MRAGIKCVCLFLCQRGLPLDTAGKVQIHLISRAKKAHLISLVLISNNNASNRMFHFEIIQISSPRYDTSYFVFQFQMAWFMSYQIES
jgi:hypothetical protein